MIKGWETFHPDVLPDIEPGKPIPLVNRHLMRSAQYFCDVTRAWRITLDAITLASGITEYDIELEPGTELVRIEEATIDGQPLAVWRAGREPYEGSRYVLTPDGRSIQVSWTPSGAMTLVLTITARPGDSATGVDEALAARYSKVIADGAKASLNKSQSEQQTFIDECNTIAARVWRGLSSARPRAKAMFL